MDASHSLVMLFNQDMLVEPALDFNKVIEFYSIIGLNQSKSIGKYAPAGRSLESKEPNEFYWSVSSQDKTSIKFQVEFFEKDKVSTESKDQIMVKFKDMSAFKS